MSETSDALNSLIAHVLENPAIREEARRAAERGQATFIWSLSCPEIRKALTERDGRSPGFKEALEVAVAGYIVEFWAREDCARFAQVQPDELEPNGCYIIAIGHRTFQLSRLATLE